MKNLILTLSIVLSFFSCNKSDESTLQKDTIIGEWQLIERFDGGSPSPIQTIINGEIISFNTDMNYSNSNYTCGIGSYSLLNDLINITIPCEPAELNFSFRFENDNLILVGHPSSCDEGCYDKYKKIEQ